jgi:hypothetical protein
MGAIESRSILTADKLRDSMRIKGYDPDDNDSLIEAVVLAAKQWADQYCNNDFLASDGTTELAIPAPVEMAVFRIAGEYFERRQAGVSSVRVGSIEQAVSIEQVDDDVKRSLSLYRRIPGF